MTIRRAFVIGAAAVLGAISAAPAAAATAVTASRPVANLSFTDFAIPGAGYTYVTGVSNAGDVAGYYGDATGQHGFIADRGSIVTIDGPPGATGVIVSSINDAGTVTGAYWNSGGDTEHGFIRDSKGTLTQLDDPGATGGDSRGTFASGISNGGVAVGYYFTTDSEGTTVFHGFVWRKGQFTTYDAPGAVTAGPPQVGTWLYGISDSGAMVGSGSYFESDTVYGEAGFVATGKSFTEFREPTVPTNMCGYTRPNAISNSGTIAVNSGNGCGGLRFAWLLKDGQYTAVSYPGATRTVISGISDSGIIAGTWTAPDGQVDGFIATGA